MTHVLPAPEATGAPTRLISLDKGVPHHLEMDDDGVPILPPSDKKSLPQIKHIVRSFMTLNYRMSLICIWGYVFDNVHLGHAADNNKVSVPWLLVTNDPDKFFDDISKMKSEALQACYLHWYTRQMNGERAFRFKHVDPADKRVHQKIRKQTALSDDEDELPENPPSADSAPDSK
jgi:hypothetical protein